MKIAMVHVRLVQVLQRRTVKHAQTTRKSSRRTHRRHVLAKKVTSQLPLTHFAASDLSVTHPALHVPVQAPTNARVAQLATNSTLAVALKSVVMQNATNVMDQKKTNAFHATPTPNLSI